MENFVWGVATAAYQVEGGANIDGRAPSIWDTFSHTEGKTLNVDTGDIACDQYHLYKDDVKLMKNLGVDAYRFSFSWSRILPNGDLAVQNSKGIEYYHNLIDELLKNNITPYVTLYHWDLPDALEKKQAGWLSKQTALDFGNYAEFCFNEYGNKVKNWITLNEPWCCAVLGYGQGVFAPGYQDKDLPYLAAHNLILAHAYAVKKFRDGKFDGVIGISNNCDWREPLTQKAEDIDAAQKEMEFFYGWFTHPVVYGDYPESMRRFFGQRLPQFTDVEKELLKDSVDFLGLNHYTTHYISKEPVSQEQVKGNGVGNGDNQGFLSNDENWEKTDMNWNIVPWGAGKMINWISKMYPNYNIYVTENGCAVKGDDKENAVNDELRCKFLTNYIGEFEKSAKENNVPLKGYFCWSFIDNFEWACGYSKRFGIVYCDYATLKRIPKKSYYCYQNIIKSSKSI